MDKQKIFEQFYSYLYSLAYNMLSSKEEAEDVVQEAYCIWHKISEPIRVPKAFLSTVVTRIAIDRLRKLKRMREVYIGDWLPEPILEKDAPKTMETKDSLSIAFLVILEKLNPVERAVFLLRKVFSYEYHEIAKIVKKNEENCRQIYNRAQKYIHERRPTFTASFEEHEKLTELFVNVCKQGNIENFESFLAEKVTLWSDGGGKAKAALKPILGRDKVTRFFNGILSKAPDSLVSQVCTINGLPGIVSYLEEIPISIISFYIVENTIQEIYMMRNPDKIL